MNVLLHRLKPHIWILALTAFALSLCGWSLASPVGSSPDEDFHLVSIWCADGGVDGMCETTDDSSERLVSEELLSASCFAWEPTVTGTCQASDSESNNLVLTKRGNFSSNYPPVYYWIMSHFASLDIQASVIQMRLFNSIFLVGLLGFTLFLIPQRRRIPIILAVAVTSVPLSQFLVGSISPSGWAIMLVPISWLALYSSLIEYRDPAKRYWLAGVYLISAFLAAGARADAAAYVLFGTFVALILTMKRNREYLRHNLPILSVLGAGLLIGLALFFASAQYKILFSGLTGLDDASATSARSSFSGAIKLLAYNIADLPSLWAGGFGTWGLGWLDTPMTSGVWFLSMFAVATVVITTMAFLEKRSIIAVSFTVLTLALVPLTILQVSAAKVGQQVQPRYIFPLIVLLIFILVSSDIDWDYRVKIPIFVGLIGLVFANASALFINMGRYINGLGSGISLEPTSWWWGGWSPWIVFGLGSGAFTLFILILMTGLSSSESGIRTNAPAKSSLLANLPN